MSVRLLVVVYWVFGLFVLLFRVCFVFVVLCFFAVDISLLFCSFCPCCPPVCLCVYMIDVATSFPSPFLFLVILKLLFIHALLLFGSSLVRTCLLLNPFSCVYMQIPHSLCPYSDTLNLL
ncbi:hypothetical protein BJ912DRAFT_954448 [Pholiota molesta]|nr:hypothetical protein BJ912DRAFT_954448 [Pholiota molesta]